MAKFSERYGYTTSKEIQRESLDNDTRNMLFNVLVIFEQYGGSLYNAFNVAWSHFLKQTVDLIPVDYMNFLKNFIRNEDWFKILDLIEFIAIILNNENIYISFNTVFVNECCAYRFVNGYIVEITSEQEIESIETALNTLFENANTHLSQALKFFSDKKSPDYRNSIKESISAVEAVCRNYTNESTLGKAIKCFEKKGLVLDSQFKSGLEKIYNYTNGDKGIRHSLMEKENIDLEDARFMLVLCSAFVNYIISKNS